MVNDKISACDHKHCTVCGKPIASGEQFCSPECERTALKQKRAQRTTTWMLFGVVIALLVIFFVISDVA